MTGHSAEQLSRLLDIRGETVATYKRSAANLLRQLDTAREELRAVKLDARAAAESARQQHSEQLAQLRQLDAELQQQDTELGHSAELLAQLSERRERDAVEYSAALAKLAQALCDERQRSEQLARELAPLRCLDAMHTARLERR